MLEIATILLSAVADALVSALIDTSTAEMRAKLHKEPVKRALMKALGTAINDYASSAKMHSYLILPLLEKNSFLKLPAVTQELTQLVRFDREPDAELIGRHWKAAFDEPPTWADFTFETRKLLTLLERELRNTDVFRPVFVAMSLAELATTATIATESLTHITSQLDQLEDLLTMNFGRLLSAFAGTSFDIRGSIRDYSRFITEKTYNFVGRQFLFDAFTRFTEKHVCGYLFVRGDPGIGKSAFAAQMVKVNGYVHHFNIRSAHINTTEIFLKNLCAQLIAKYSLDVLSLPPEAMQDAGFLNMLLENISEGLQEQEKVVVVVDALDEVDPTSFLSGANTLYLPMNLPPNVYFLVTTRRVPLNLRIDCAQQQLDIVHDSAENIADIHEYVERALLRPGIQTYIAAQGIDNELFTEHLVEKSEGNFMYLRYVLPEIEHGEYRDLGLEVLPVGLENYYEDHLRRMSNRNKEDWIRYELPVIATLTAVQAPVSVHFIHTLTGIPLARINTILLDWEQFLHMEHHREDEVQQERYRVYHISFHDFLAQKKSVRDERLSIVTEAHRDIARRLLRRKPTNGELS